ncbi:MAG: PQQ-dependent sugar dehydrogenase [Sphingomonadales bacterium]
MKRRMFRILTWVIGVPLAGIASLAAYVAVFGFQDLINAGPDRPSLSDEEAGITVTTLAEGLNHPWSLAFLPDGRMLVTERVGQLRIMERDGHLSGPIEGVPEVGAKGQGGLMDIILDPDFETNHIIYFSFAEADEVDEDKVSTAVARAKFIEDAGTARIENLDIIFRQTPKVEGWGHFGSRLVIDDEGYLFITLGERFNYRERAQDLDTTLGKIVRINRDGSIPADNPFVGQANILPEIWTFGHRNVQGAALHPETRQLWAHEHGARGGDELNVIQKGHNYGWPVITLGRDYSFAKIGEGTHKEGMDQPLYYWDPSIAPSGMTFITKDLFPGWKGDILIGSLAHKRLVRLRMKGEKVVEEIHLLGLRKTRVRDVREGPDGTIYVLTDEEDGAVLKLTPRR